MTRPTTHWSVAGDLHAGAVDGCGRCGEARPVLVRKQLAQIVTFWRPGSHEWTWADEYADLINDPVTERIDARVRREGIDFANDFAPVLLGSDGRVWDGHHRICLAIRLGIPYLWVEIAGPNGESAPRNGDPAECLPCFPMPEGGHNCTLREGHDGPHVCCDGHAWRSSTPTRPVAAPRTAEQAQRIVRDPRDAQEGA